MTINSYSEGVNDSVKILIELICRQSNGLKIVHFNARSLNISKLDYARHIFENSNVDVICVTETWFHRDVEDVYLGIPNYQLFRNDRNQSNKNKNDKKGGGVAIYVKSCLKAKCVSVSKNSNVEFINVEIGGSLNNVLVSCVYNPHRSHSLDSFFTILEPMLTKFAHLIVCGDFNVNLLRSDNLSKSFVDAFTLTGLSAINCLHPTRFGEGSDPSLLDLFLVSDMSSVLHYSQISFVSDHDLIFCALDVRLERSSPVCERTYFDYKKINYDELYNAAINTNWDECWYGCTVDEKLNILRTQIAALFNSYVPIRKLRCESTSCPWYDANVKAAIDNKTKLYRKWKHKKTVTALTEYRNARNSATSTIRAAKKRFFANKLNASLPSKVLWNNIRKLNIQNRNASRCDIDPNDLNDYFLNVCNTTLVNSSTNCDTSNVIDMTPSLLNNSPVPDFKNRFNFVPVCELDVIRCVCRIKSNATGDDGISIKFVKILLPYIVRPLTHIINHCFTTSTFPEAWKIGVVVPLPKKSLASECSDFRPIVILPCLAKVCEMLLAEQISDYLSNYKLLSPYQSGFRPGHSCSTATMKVIDDIRSSFDMEFITLLCLLDFSKAFDSVDHELLVYKLKYYFGFSDFAANLLASYLKNRQQKVNVSGRCSDLKSVKCGVPQGSVLGPLLFSMFINDLFKCVVDVRVHAYADDVQLYMSNRVGLVEDLCCRFNEDLQRIFNWSVSNNLLLNPRKSCVVLISKYELDCDTVPSLFIGGHTLSVEKSAKSLGYHINSKLNCVDHVNEIVRKVYIILRNLRNSAEFTPEPIRIRLAKQLIIPYLSYMSCVYCKLDSLSLHKLEVLFNHVSRYVFGHCVGSKKLLGCSVQNFLYIRGCVFLYKLMSSKQPPYLYEKLCFGQYERNNKLIVPRYKYLCSTRFFFVNTIRVWNSLPIWLRQIEGEGCFKKSIIKYFSNN